MANNSNCGVGVAYNAKIGGKIQDVRIRDFELNLMSEWGTIHEIIIKNFEGVRMLDGKATDALEASGLSFGRELIDVYVNCWGPKDDGKTFGKPGPLAAKALKEGATLVGN